MRKASVEQTVPVLRKLRREREEGYVDFDELALRNVVAEAGEAASRKKVASANTTATRAAAASCAFERTLGTPSPGKIIATRPTIHTPFLIL
jgi:hypothetical protein